MSIRRLDRCLGQESGELSSLSLEREATDFSAKVETCESNSSSISEAKFVTSYS